MLLLKYSVEDKYADRFKYFSFYKQEGFFVEYADYCRIFR